ncbi:LacI family DNA-binding transcriptional regulator, partial [Vibrio sp.]|uniref:LacI family DNA-binding transcriptional regulator n=1 Tax=Vibrio sp. TaxID=678 RepID=UPI003D146B05
MSSKNNRPTVYDVARLAGVSPSTVSRFLNRTTFVSQEKSDNIERAIQSLGYKPSYPTPTSVKKRSMTVGVLIQHTESPHSNRILNDMEKVLIAQGYSLVIATGHWNKRIETQALEYLANSRVDGVIIVTGSLMPEQILAFAADIPVIAVGYDVQGENVRSINLDNVLGGYMATLHLLQQGHMNIAHIKGMPNQPDAFLRGIATDFFDVKIGVGGGEAKVVFG